MGAISSALALVGAAGRPVGPPAIADPTIDTSDWGNTVGSLIGTGLQAWEAKMQTDLLSAQINKGQIPSIVSGPNGTPSAGYSYSIGPNGQITYAAGNSIGAATSAAGTIFSSGTIWLILIVLVLFMVLRR